MSVDRIKSYVDSFHRYVVIDVISNSPQLESKEYHLGRYYGIGDDKKLFHYCSLELNYRDNQPLLSFTYKIKDHFTSPLKLRKGDKLYFCNENDPYLELEVIKSPFGRREERTVNFYLLEKDIECLLKNCFSKLIIVYDNGMPQTIIENIWYGYENWKQHVENIISNEVIFNGYVNAYNKALQEAGIISCSSRTKKTKEVRIKIDQCFVYLMHDSKNGYHKIGISKTPKYREKTLQSEKPTIDMICAKEYPSRKIAEAIESALHKVYEECRIRGEWFNLSETDIAMLKETLK